LDQLAVLLRDSLNPRNKSAQKNAELVRDHIASYHI